MTSETSQSPGSAVESGRIKRRKCVIFVGCFFNMLVVLGTTFSINTLYVELLNVFQTTRRETSLIQTTLIGITFGAGLISGIIVRRVGIKISLLTGAVMSSIGFFLSWFATSVPYLIATLGVLSGLGNSLIFISTTVFVATTFNDKRSLALSLLVVGSGFGQILVPLLLARLLNVYGWRGCLLITSGLHLNIIISCLLGTSSLGARMPFQLLVAQNTKQQNKKEGHLRNLLNPTFLIFVATAPISFACITSMIVLFMDFLVSQGQTLETSVNTFIGYSIASILSRACAGALNLCKKLHVIVLFWSFSILAGCSLLLLKVSTNFTITVVLLLLIGSGAGGMIAQQSVVIIELAGVENAAIATGIPSTFGGIVAPVIGVLFGWIFDTTISYSIAFDVSGYVIMGSAFINFVVFGVQVYLKKQRTKQQEQDGANC